MHSGGAKIGLMQHSGPTPHENNGEPQETPGPSDQDQQPFKRQDSAELAHNFLNWVASGRRIAAKLMEEYEASTHGTDGYGNYTDENPEKSVAQTEKYGNKSDENPEKSTENERKSPKNAGKSLKNRPKIEKAAKESLSMQDMAPKWSQRLQGEPINRIEYEAGLSELPIGALFEEGKLRASYMESGHDWKPMPMFEDMGYMVSSGGLVAKYSQLITPTVNQAGNPYIRLYRKMGLYKIAAYVKLSTLVCTVFNGEPPSPFHVAINKNQNQADCRAVNLRWAITRKRRNYSKDREFLLRKLSQYQAVLGIMPDDGSYRVQDIAREIALSDSAAWNACASMVNYGLLKLERDDRNYRGRIHRRGKFGRKPYFLSKTKDSDLTLKRIHQEALKLGEAETEEWVEEQRELAKETKAAHEAVQAARYADPDADADPDDIGLETGPNGVDEEDGYEAYDGSEGDSDGETPAQRVMRRIASNRAQEMREEWEEEGA